MAGERNKKPAGHPGGFCFPRIKGVGSASRVPAAQETHETGQKPAAHQFILPGLMKCIIAHVKTPWAVATALSYAAKMTFPY